MNSTKSRSAWFVGLAAGALAITACQNNQAPSDPEVSALIVNPPPPPPPPPANGKNRFSGEAIGLWVKIPPFVNKKIVVAGPLPPSGGADEDALVSYANNGVEVELLSVETVGQGNKAESEATAVDVDISVGGHQIEVDILRAEATAECRNGKPWLSGNSQIFRLRIDGLSVVVSGQPNTKIPLGLGWVIINEQIKASNSITVNALHVKLGTTDVIVSSAHADIFCGRCGDAHGDFVSGSGHVVGGSDFGFIAGVTKDGFFGHFVYKNPKVKSTAITGYTKLNGNGRRFTGTALINDSPGTFTAVVWDNGGPGGGVDSFELWLSTGYHVKGTVIEADIKVRPRPPDCI